MSDKNYDIGQIINLPETLEEVMIVDLYDDKIFFENKSIIGELQVDSLGNMSLVSWSPNNVN